MEWYKYPKKAEYLDHKITSIAPTSDGGFILTKIFNKKEQINENTIISTTNSFDVAIEKYDSNGDLMWYKQLAGERIDYSFSIVETKDGGFLTEISFENKITLENGITFTANGESGILLKYSKDGKLENYKQVDSSYSDKRRTVLETQDGGIIYAFR